MSLANSLITILNFMQNELPKLTIVLLRKLIVDKFNAYTVLVFMCRSQGLSTSIIIISSDIQK